VENATAGHGNECLIRAMETRLKESPGNKFPFKIQVSNTTPTVGNLDQAQWIYGKFNPVTSHREKYGSTTTGTRTCGRPGDVCVGGFAGKPGRANGK
jgi:hypothetical protein